MNLFARVWIAIFILLINLTVAYTQQTGKISGTILDQNDLPIPFATVTLKGTNRGVFTNADGNFELLQLPVGTQILQVSSSAYIPKEITVVVKASGFNRVTISLEEAMKELEEVTVVGETEKARLEKTAQAITVVETKAAKIQSADLGEVIAQTQGVNVRRTGGLGSSARISLNGLTDGQIRFFLDGIPLEMMGYPTGIANIPVNLVDRIEIYRGVVPVRFGADALGGAFNVVSPADFLGTTGSTSYQFGSFNTHRATADIQHRTDSVGFFVRGSGFYDFSNNNYEIDVEIANEVGRLEPATVERFHDDYEAYGVNVEIGFQNQSWAKNISMRAYTNGFFQDIQNDFQMATAFGEAIREQRSYGGLFNWQSLDSRQLRADATVGYSYSEVEFIDTTTCVYNWRGECVTRRIGRGGEAGFGEQNTLVWNHSLFGRFNAELKIREEDNLRFTSAPSDISRSGENRLFVGQPGTVDVLTSQSGLTNLINGIEYEANSLLSGFQTIVFAKSYYQWTTAQDFDDAGGSTIILLKSQNHYWGFGSSSRYRLSDKFSLKASYEWATRLPRIDEVLGDGALIAPNGELKPERSHNANLEVNYVSGKTLSSIWKFEMNGFLRHIDDLILLQGNFLTFRYLNILAATSQGVECSISWTSRNNQLAVSGNATYQDYRARTSGTGFDQFAGDRIPNRPYLLANSSVRYRLLALFQNKDVLNIFMNSRYIHEFFLSWESLGNPGDKITIPSQFAHGMGVSYEFPFSGLRSVLSAEVQNITNEKIFDSFGVQRPGRAYFTKLTIQF